MSDCAVGPDGKLLDAKDIQWFEDADSLELINHAATSLSITTANSPATIHLFFCGEPAPAVVVAGACCSGHTTRPSNKITDPDNAKASSLSTMCSSNKVTNADDAEVSSFTTTHKHKASWTMAAGRRINRKVTSDDKGSTDGCEISNYEPDVAEHPATSDIEAGNTKPEEDPNVGYVSTKAMGDADHVTSPFISRLSCLYLCALLTSRFVSPSYL